MVSPSLNILDETPIFTLVGSLIINAYPLNLLFSSDMSFLSIELSFSSYIFILVVSSLVIGFSSISLLAPIISSILSLGKKLVASH
ncbi:hypothetical protein D3C81_941280 [compost metagenome]